MRHQIRTLQVPTAWGTGAFVAVPARSSTAEFNGQNMVTGAPGNVVVASPRPAALRDNAWGGQWQPSSVSPDAFLPSIYVARVNQSMHFPGDTNITNVSPVPAQPIGAVPSNGWSKPRIGGTTVTRAIRPFTQWNTYGN